MAVMFSAGVMVQFVVRERDKSLKWLVRTFPTSKRSPAGICLALLGVCLVILDRCFTTELATTSTVDRGALFV